MAISTEWNQRKNTNKAVIDILYLLIRRAVMAGYEYKVLTQKDKFFSRKFDPEQLQAALNSYANEGWRLITAATAEIGSGIGSRDEIIFMLERERP
jgi:hypothetical protein